jgi:hypothetical protein
LNSSIASLVDPVPIKVLLGFFLPRRFELALRFRLTMRNAIPRGATVVIASLGALARRAQIDQFSHRPRW